MIRLLARPSFWLLIPLLACAGGLTGCASNKDEPVNITQLRQTATAANDVYLCDVIRGEHDAIALRVKSVWRHDPSRGPAPAVGSMLDMLVNKSITEPAIAAVLVFVYDPPLPLLNGNSMPNRTVYVFGDEIAAYRLTVSEAEKIVRAIKDPPPPRDRPVL